MKTGIHFYIACILGQACLFVSMSRTLLFLSNPQDSSENIFHFSIFNSGHNGLVQYLLELSKLSHTGKDCADKKTVFLFFMWFFFLIKMIIFFPQGACIKLIDACLVSSHFSWKYFVTTKHFQVAGEMQY